MRRALVSVHDVSAGILEETIPGKSYRFTYFDSYSGPPVSLTMPTAGLEFVYDRFPPFFDGLLPEGMQLEGLLRVKKIDRLDYYSQLVAVGRDLVGAVTVAEIPA